MSNAMSTCLMYLDCSGVTTENSAIFVYFLIETGQSVVLVTLNATFLSVFVDIEWEIITLAVSVSFYNRVTVPVVVHSKARSTKAVIVFVDLGGIVRASPRRKTWGFAFVSLEAVLTCIVKCGKCMRRCVLSMTTLFFLMKCVHP